jgi:hypothetical protein
MALRDDVAAIRDRTLRALDDAHDYFTYSKGAWRIVQIAVKRVGRPITLRNRVTQTRIGGEDLGQRSQRYTQELASATLQKFASIFECFLHDLLSRWLQSFPQSLASRQISAKDIFALPDKDAIIGALIEKELKDVFFDRPTNWFSYLRDRVGVSPLSDLDVEQFVEIKATRDVLVHGQGVANAYYLDKAGKAARVAQGQSLNVSEPYHLASWELVRKLVREIGDAVAAKP